MQVCHTLYVLECNLTAGQNNVSCRGFSGLYAIAVYFK